MDDRLTWRFHINELCKKLGRAVGMLYKIRHFCPKTVLGSLYYSLFYSHMTYGLPVWGNANQIFTNKLLILQKKAILAISFADYKSPSAPIFKELGILRFNDLYTTQLAALMWDLDHNTIPLSLSSYFTRSNEVHNHLTRMATSNKLIIKQCNTEMYGNRSFQIEGAKMLNDLKEQELYNSAISKQAFLNKFKKNILTSY